MTSRPASPPPIVRWPFYAGASALFVTAAYLLLFMVGRPPSVPPLVVAMFCMGGSVVVSVIPFVLENERRLRIAEAAARDGAEAQLRRLAQTADQLTHVVSRSQSTEEQIGQALGSLEEMAEKMVAQSDELTTALTRSTDREQASQSEEIQRLTEERDQKLTGLEIRLNAMSVALGEAQTAIKKSTTASTRAIEALAARLDDIAGELRAAIAARPPGIAPEPAPFAATAPMRHHGRSDTATSGDEAPALRPTGTQEQPAAEVTEPAAAAKTDERPAPPFEGNEPPADVAAPVATPEPAAAEMPSAETTLDAPPEPQSESAEAAPAAVRPPRRPRAHRTPVKPADDEPASHEIAAPVEEPPPAGPAAPLELALEGMPEPRPVMRLNRREPAGSTSLVATAYIGIGNKLYLRGDGPGLSWERGVPMQFLAIGKWGWTTTEATVPVTCRVYRNDDTPMLEENIVIDPGTKAETTPKF